MPDFTDGKSAVQCDTAHSAPIGAFSYSDGFAGRGNQCLRFADMQTPTLGWRGGQLACCADAAW